MSDPALRVEVVDDVEAVIAGDEAGLVSLAGYVVGEDVEDLAARFASRLEVKVTEAASRVRLSVLDGRLVIEAGPAGAEWLASTIARFGRGEISGGGEHLHVEAYPGHPFLEEGSTALILELEPESVD